jgi:hypothetical protein
MGTGYAGAKPAPARDQWLIPWSDLTKYGTMEVKGADQIPFKSQQEK